MTKIRLKALFVTILSIYITPSSYAQNIEDNIVKSNRVKIWKTLLKRVVDNELFQKMCGANGGKSKEECIRILSKETLLFDEKNKRYVLQVIAQSDLLPLKDILKDRWNGFDIDLILGITVPAVEIENNKEALPNKQTLEQVLVQKAIKLMGIGPKKEENEHIETIPEAVDVDTEENASISAEAVGIDTEEEISSANAPVEEDSKPIISNIVIKDEAEVSNETEKFKSYITSYLSYGLLMIVLLLILLLGGFFFRKKKK